MSQNSVEMIKCWIFNKNRYDWTIKSKLKLKLYFSVVYFSGPLGSLTFKCWKLSISQVSTKGPDMRDVALFYFLLSIRYGVDQTESAIFR
jgi:hypothetical protein